MQIDRVGHAVVAHDEPGALLHRLLAEVEEAAVAADQHGTVAAPSSGLVRSLWARIRTWRKAEVIAEEGVDAGRQRQPVVAGGGNRRRRREIAALLENRRRRVRPHHAQHQRGRQKQEDDESRNIDDGDQHAGSGPRGKRTSASSRGASRLEDAPQRDASSAAWIVVRGRFRTRSCGCVGAMKSSRESASIRWPRDAKAPISPPFDLQRLEPMKMERVAIARRLGEAQARQAGEQDRQRDA